MFLHLSVILSTAPPPPGRHPPPGKTHPWADTPLRATAADGTHPTGMHSCFKVCSHLRSFSPSFSPFNSPFLGGLSLHLNHLIASRMANYDWPFGTLPFGLFLVKFGHKGPWDISYDLFWSFLKYVNFWRFQGRLSTFQKMGGLRKSKFSRWRGDRCPPYRFSFRRRGP